MSTLRLLLVFAALILGAITIFQSNGRSFVGWAVVCLAAWALLPSVV